jgi:hypothetical protein
MKSIKLLFGMVVFLLTSAFAQDMSYVSKQSGDTLFVKSDAEFGATNTLYSLIHSDSSSPAGRVYMLKNGGIYSCVNAVPVSAKHKTVIMGPTNTSLKIDKGTNPPIISGSSETGVSTNGGMSVDSNVLVKNIDLEIGNSAGNGGGWAFFNIHGPNHRLQVDNCIMEHTWWVWVGGPPGYSSVFMTNDYFVNLDGHTCRRNGGVVDFNGTTPHQDTLWVENCTHVNNQGTLYKFRSGYTVDKAFFNHNDFIDCAGYVIMNNGDQTNFSVTNNIFVNVQLQGYDHSLFTADNGEVDADDVPMGLINIRVDSTFTSNIATHGVYADHNLIYWDASLTDASTGIVATLNSGSGVNSSKNWKSQMIAMNDRTTGLFSNASYPLLTNGTWITGKMPAFKATDVLFTDQLAVLKDYAVNAVDTTWATPLDSWRQSSNVEVDNFIYADWPIAIDLSYTDADLMTAAHGGFPVGDLNWFPTQYASWEAQKSSEAAYIDGILTGTLGVQKSPEVPQQFQLQQNYPNPFNPSTDISYTLAKTGNVTLKVFNLLGQEVATLVNGIQTANTHTVHFNASGLASGVYLYELRAGNNVVTKKMTLMK